MSATSAEYIKCISISATADNALTVGKAANLTSTSYASATCDVASAGEFAGVVSETKASGEVAEVIFSGRGPVYADGNSVNIAAGDPLKVGTSGAFVKAATAGDLVVAYALEAATADGVYIQAIIGATSSRIHA